MYLRRFFRIFTGPLFAFVLVACQPAQPLDTRPIERGTPLLFSVQSAPVPFTGSDERIHLVYELWMTNFSSGDCVVETVEVLGDGKVLATLDTAAVAGRLQPAGTRQPSATMARSTSALLFLHVTLPAGAPPPQRLAHRISARFSAAPPDGQQITHTGGDTAVDQREPVVIGPPLLGERYIAADSCCDAMRHTRAALPLNGRMRLAQRFAVDWEQLDERDRIYAGPQQDLASYTIFGKEVLAVADARVDSVLDGLPEQVPGKFPAGLPLEQSDGNSIILDLGDSNFALYAHLQLNSIRVRPGQLVRRGEVIGLVGNSGNSIAPHLHFHIVDSRSPLGSNGLPYLIDGYSITGRSPGTAAFDMAEQQGTPLAVTPFTPALRVVNALPLDQNIIRFAP